MTYTSGLAGLSLYVFLCWSGPSAIQSSGWRQTEPTPSSSWRSVPSFFFFSSRRRHTRLQGDWSSDVCSSDLVINLIPPQRAGTIAVQADLVGADKRWCEVNHLTYESVKHKNVHVIGDSTIGQIGRASCRERV